ncbi:hypothetical protein [Parasphingorhabdus pacifica]
MFSRLKYVVLTMLLGMHLGIAVILGLPLSSCAMLIADAVFLPDRFYRFLARKGRRVFRRPVEREAETAPQAEAARTAAEPAHAG